MTPPGHKSAPADRVLDQSMFLGRVEEEISRSLRTRRHLSVAVLFVTGTARPNPATIAENLARHIRRYDHVTVSGVAEVMFLFAETTREHAEAILARLRAIALAVPVLNPGEYGRAWGLATWPADGADPATLVQAARRRVAGA